MCFSTVRSRAEQASNLPVRLPGWRSVVQRRIRVDVRRRWNVSGFRGSGDHTGFLELARSRCITTRWVEEVRRSGAIRQAETGRAGGRRDQAAARWQQP
jgi:hypothetical protein